VDIHITEEHHKALDERIKLAGEYRQARSEAYQSKYKLEMILVSKLAIIRSFKSNAGYDMALLMLMENGFLDEEQLREVKGYYKTYLEQTAKYKGLDRLLKAYESKTTFMQSVMRFQRMGEE